MEGIIIHQKQENYPYILFLHGWGLDVSYLEDLAKDHQLFANCILLDLPGFGKKAPLEKAYDIEDYLAYIHRVLKENHIQISLIVGHSFGGKLAMYYASRIEPVPLILLAPSILPKKRHKKWWNLLFKKPSKPSRDYLNAEGYLRSTLVRMVHRYPVFEMQHFEKPVVLFIGSEDEEVTIQQMEEAHHYLRNSELWIEKGNHFAYQRYKSEIIKKIKEVLAK